jgi:hypothetical protein
MGALLAVDAAFWIGWVIIASLIAMGDLEAGLILPVCGGFLAASMAWRALTADAWPPARAKEPRRPGGKP